MFSPVTSAAGLQPTMSAVASSGSAVFTWIKSSLSGASRPFSSPALRRRQEKSQSQTSQSATVDPEVAQRVFELARGCLLPPRQRSAFPFASVVSSPTFFENKHGFTKEEFRGIRSYHTSSSQQSSSPHHDRPAALPSSLSSFVSQQIRRFSASYRQKSGQVRLLEEEANRRPSDPVIQSLYLKEAVKINPQYVADRFESGQYAHNAECTQSYMRALHALGRIEELKPKADQAMHSAGMASPTLNIPNPLPVTMKSASFRSWEFWGMQFFGLLKTIAFLFIVFLILDAGKLYNNSKNYSPEDMEKKEGKCTFDDVAGVEEAKEELMEVVEFLRNPEKFHRFGAKIPKGVLVTGNPGTGKTLLARAVAGEAGVPFFYVSGSEFEEMWVGVGASRVKSLFESARKDAPCIIFIDELDTVGSQRVNDPRHPYARQTLNQLLVEMDGFDEFSGIVLMGATNFPDSLDKALTRAGRFDSHIHVPMPDVRGRFAILKVHAQKVLVNDDVNLEVVARGTPGFSGADLKNLINQAAIRATFDGADSIRMKHLDFAREKIMMGSEQRSRKMKPMELRTTAYHEAGHALVALMTAGSDPVYKATIIPRGNALGMVQQLPEDDKYSISRRELKAKMAVAMGGYVAEELEFGKENISAGASSDLKNSTAIARSMVTKFGMSDKVGYVVVGDEAEVSPKLNELVESEIKRLAEEAYEHAKMILTVHKSKHQRIAEALLYYETLSGEELKQIIDGKKLKRKI